MGGVGMGRSGRATPDAHLSRKVRGEDGSPDIHTLAGRLLVADVVEVEDGDAGGEAIDAEEVPAAVF
jgi:hypothetical protein